MSPGGPLRHQVPAGLPGPVAELLTLTLVHTAEFNSIFFWLYAASWMGAGQSIIWGRSWRISAPM